MPGRVARSSKSRGYGRRGSKSTFLDSGQECWSWVERRHFAEGQILSSLLFGIQEGGFWVTLRIKVSQDSQG